MGNCPMLSWLLYRDRNVIREYCNMAKVGQSCELPPAALLTMACTHTGIWRAEVLHVGEASSDVRFPEPCCR